MRSTVSMSQRPMLGRINGLRRRSIQTGSTTPHNRRLHITGDAGEHGQHHAAGRAGCVGPRLGQAAQANVGVAEALGSAACGLGGRRSWDPSSLPLPAGWWTKVAQCVRWLGCSSVTAPRCIEPWRHWIGRAVPPPATVPGWRRDPTRPPSPAGGARSLGLAGDRGEPEAAG